MKQRAYLMDRAMTEGQLSTTVWHYQLMKHTTPEGHTYYAVHEYYPLDTGPAWTEKPVTVDGESINEVVQMLYNIIIGILKHGVKDYE